MAMRTALVGLALLGVATAACSGDDGGGRAITTTTFEQLPPITVPCDRFAGTAQRIADAQQQLYAPDTDPAARRAALEALAAELTALRAGAPTDVAAAIGRVVDGFRRSESLVGDPTPEHAQQLATLGQQMSTDSQAISAYVVARCAG
jgi:hypothetical protein